MTDVARVAGVSHQTVSRVINDHAGVRPATRVRVQAAMVELAYRPNRAARALVTGRSGLVGVVAVNTIEHGPASIVAGLEHAARAAGYFLVIASVSEPQRDSLSEAVDRLVLHGVDGLVVLAPLASAEAVLADLPDAVTVVVVEGDAHGRYATVNVDQAGGARLAVEHLLGLGHHGVWHVAGPRSWWEASRRLAGWQEALAAAGIQAPPHLSGDWSARSGYDAGQMLARIPEVTGIFAANDQMALGVLRALHETGRRVPDDVSVMGFDDIPEAAYLTPPLTTVRQDFDEVGRRALQLLLDQLVSDADATPAPVSVTVPASLVVRASTGAAPATHDSTIHHPAIHDPSRTP